MAEESRRSPGSKRPIVAWVIVGILAVSVPIVAVVSYAVGVRSEIRARKGGMVQLLKFRRDLDPGEEITEKDIQVVEVDGLVSHALGNVVDGRDADYAIGRILNQAVKKEDWVKYGQVAGEEIVPVMEDMVAVSLELDPRSALGDILRVYDRVNILARLSVNKGPLRTYRVIEGVRVMAIGGRGESGSGMATGPKVRMGRVPRSYRSITIEIREEESLRLANVLSHRAGSIGIELCKFGKEGRPGDGKINPALRSLAAQAAPPQEATPAGQPEP